MAFCQNANIQFTSRQYLNLFWLLQNQNDSGAKAWIVKPGNTNWSGRLSPVHLLIKVACFVIRVKDIFNLKSSWPRLVSTRRSIVLNLPIQQGFIGKTHRYLREVEQSIKDNSLQRIHFVKTSALVAGTIKAGGLTRQVALVNRCVHF
jgi:hypothetical protein